MKAIFLDRDGTVIEEVNYLNSFEKLKIFPFSKTSIKILKNLNFKIFLITNQSGVARGYFSEEFVIKINSYLCDKLNIDDFFYCPHHPDENCDCRKPKIGMILNAKKKYPEIELNKSYIIGDKEIDVITGKNAGLKSILVLTGYGKDYLNSSKADFIVKNLYYASILINSIENAKCK